MKTPKKVEPKDSKRYSQDFKTVLEIRFDSDAGDDLSVREWLCDLLQTVWSEGECFSGKRPWGNSGWEYDIYNSLAKAGVIPGELDEDGCLIELKDANMAAAYVSDLIYAAMSLEHS